ncbi:MAG: hypothetical protein ACM3QX_14110, partial [Syntrophomonadaceae bacterium]
MEKPEYSEEVNPIPEIIDGATYSKLQSYGFLDITGLRNYCIKREYRNYRQEGLSMWDCLEKISKHYGLGVEYIRKMIGVKRMYVRKRR